MFNLQQEHYNNEEQKSSDWSIRCTTNLPRWKKMSFGNLIYGNSISNARILFHVHAIMEHTCSMDRGQVIIKQSLFPKK